MKDPRSTFYDPRLQNLSFETYLSNNTLFERDALTKRLLCKENDTIEKHSLKHAIDILKQSETGVYHDLEDSFLQFQKAFPRWNSFSPKVNSCVKGMFERELRHVEKLYASYGIEFRGYFDRLKELNKFDMELYMFTASLG